MRFKLFAARRWFVAALRIVGECQEFVGIVGESAISCDGEVFAPRLLSSVVHRATLGVLSGFPNSRDGSQGDVRYGARRHTRRITDCRNLLIGIQTKTYVT